jgi:hypothetical protein
MKEIKSNRDQIAAEALCTSIQSPFRRIAHVTTHHSSQFIPPHNPFATLGSAFISASLISFLEVFGNAADTSSIRLAVCCLFFLFSQTILIIYMGASDGFCPARDLCCLGYHDPFNLPLVDRCNGIAFSTNFAIVGSREMHP